MRILFLGDVGVLRGAPSGGAWPPPISGDASTRIVLNWELPIGEVSTRYKPMQLAAATGAVQAIAGWSGVVASLTNNHALDAGADGLLATASALREAGAEVFGFLQRDNAASRAWSWERPEGRLCVLPWTTAETSPIPGSLQGSGPILWPGLEAASQEVKRAKVGHEWVVAYIHWDIELFHSPSPQARLAARGLAAAGADLIIGHHPHVVRGRESMGGADVFYSLGNYYFDNLPADPRGIARHQVARCRESIGVLATFQRGQAPVIEVVSFFQERGLPPRRDPRQRGVKRMRRASAVFAGQSDAAYASWYGSALVRFQKYEYRFCFRLLSLSGAAWLRLIRWRLARLLRRPAGAGRGGR